MNSLSLFTYILKYTHVQYLLLNSLGFFVGNKTHICMFPSLAGGGDLSPTAQLKVSPSLLFASWMKEEVDFHRKLLSCCSLLLSSQLFSAVQPWNRRSIVTFSYCGLSPFSSTVFHSRPPSPSLHPVPLLSSCKPLMVISCCSECVSVSSLSPRVQVLSLSSVLHC